MNKKNKLLKKILLSVSLVAVFGLAFVKPVVGFKVCAPVDNDDPVFDSSYEFCKRGIVSVFPNDNSVGVLTNPILSITFANPTTKSTGNLRVLEVGAGVVQTIQCSTLGGSGTTFTSTLALAANKDYYINYDSFCFANATSITDSITWNFSTRSSLTLISSSPFSGENDVCLTKGLTLNFNQPVYSDQNNRGGTIRLSCTGSAPITEVCSPSTFSGSGTATLFKSYSFAQNTSCNIRISNNCIHNAGNQYLTGTEINFNTNATQCTGGICSFPLVNPADDATGVRLDTKATLIWDDIWTLYHDGPYDASASLIEIRRSDNDTLFAQYNLDKSADNTSSLLEVTGVNTNIMTIVPKVNLLPDTSFYMNFTGVPLLNCPPFIIGDNTTWNFTTGSSGPIMLETKLPRNNRVDVAIDTYLELKYDNPVFTGSGNLRVYEKFGDVLIDTIPAASPRIYGIGTNLIRFFPIIGFVYERDYYVTVDEGFLNGGSVATPAAAVEKGDWFFRTKRMDKEPFFRNWGDKPSNGFGL